MRLPAESGSRRAAAAVALCSCLLAFGCTAPVALPPAPILTQPLNGEADKLNAYKLQVGDTLDIKFPLNPELNEQVTVTPDGMISTAFLSNVQAYGGTVEDLRQRLGRGYGSVLSKPRLSVILRTFAPNRVYVAGEVPSPGEFITVGPNLTVSQAITRAGGVKFSANRTKVFVIRRGPGDKPQAYAVDYFGVITGKNPAADIRLAQYDEVYVARTGIGDLYQAVNQYFLQFFPIGATIGATVLP